MSNIKLFQLKNGKATELQVDVSDLVRGKRDKFSLDMLVMRATRAGRKVALAVD